MALLKSNTIIYGTANIQSVLTVGAVTPNNSISSTTGSFIVYGGAGIGGNVYAGGNIYANTSGTTTTVANLITTSGLFWANGVNALSPSYGNTQMLANLATATINTTGTISTTNPANATGLGTGALTVSQGGASVYQDLWVGGNIYANALNTVTTSILSIQDPLLYLASQPTYPYNYELGFYGHFVGGPANVYAHTGFVRNHVDNTWYLFSNIPEPTGNTINLASANIVYDTLKLGNVTTTGNIVATGTASVGNLITTSGLFWANGVNALSPSYGNTQMLANLSATGNPITIGSNLTVNGNLLVNNTLQSRLGGNVIITANSLVLNNGLTAITLITQTATGNLYTSAPTVAISAPTSQFGGIQATANANIGVVFIGNITSQGSNYTPGQILTMVGLANTYSNATFTITSTGNGVGGSGNVTSISLLTAGSLPFAPANPVSFTVNTGGGTGIQANLYYGVTQLGLYSAGTGYIEQPTITFSGGGGSGAAAYATVGTPNNVTATGANLSIVLPQGEVVKFVTSNVILGVNSNTLPISANTLTATALTGNAIAAGGMGVVGNIYGTSRIGFTNVANSSSAAYTVYNSVYNSVDLIFGA